MRVLLLEAGSDVGGVWWWNRYPGARLDSESYAYADSFPPELLAEWNLTEHFACQAELQRYFSHVSDRFGLRQHIRFDSLVTSAHFRDDGSGWNVLTENGNEISARYLITAVGPLTSPTFPRIEGRERFAGEPHHTSRWPSGDVSFQGKRLAVIGTGAPCVQAHRPPLGSGQRVSARVHLGGARILQQKTNTQPTTPP